MTTHSSNYYFVKVLGYTSLPKLELLMIHLFILLLKWEGCRLPQSVFDSIFMLLGCTF